METPTDLLEINAGANIAAALSGMGILAVLLRKLWRIASTEETETRRDRAESGLYETLQGEIGTLRARLDDYRSRLELLERRHRMAQTIAIEAYAMVSCAVKNTDTLDLEAVKACLLRIIKGEEPPN